MGVFVFLPLILPLCAAITFAGSAPGRTTTVPLQVYVLLESGSLDGAIVLSVVLLAVSVGVLPVENPYLAMVERGRERGRA